MSVLRDDETTVGERLHALRIWRGMSLAEVGGLAGVSAAYLSMAERGLRTIDRRSMICALATALRVSESDLTGGPHLSANREQSAPHTTVPALRMALETTSLHDRCDGEARPVPELASELEAIRGLYYRKCDVVSAGERLPRLIEELHIRSWDGAAEADRIVGLGLLTEACGIAGFFAKLLGYSDLAHVAAMRADQAARLLDDPVMIGKAAFTRFHTVPPSLRSWDRAMAMAKRSAETLQPHAKDSEALSVLGMLTLSAALGAAVLQQPGNVEHWLAMSADLASRVPDAMSANWQSFSATNVSVWRTALAVERGESGAKIAELAAAVDERKLTTRTRRADFLIDVGRGVARDPKAAGEAIGWLRRAEETAPQRVRNSATAREAVGYLITRAKATVGGAELRGMASRMGVAH